jgi:hypothetical protein
MAIGAVGFAMLTVGVDAVVAVVVVAVALTAAAWVTSYTLFVFEGLVSQVRSCAIQKHFPLRPKKRMPQKPSAATASAHAAIDMSRATNFRWVDESATLQCAFVSTSTKLAFDVVRGNLGSWSWAEVVVGLSKRERPRTERAVQAVESIVGADRCCQLCGR